MESSKATLESVLNSRVVIPRWKPPTQAIERDSFDKEQLVRRAELGGQWVRYLESTFEQFPSRSTANELYETAFMYGRTEGLPSEVLKLLKGRQEAVDRASSSLRQHYSSLAQPELVLGEDVDVHQRGAISEIARYRSLLAESPGRPFCWSELSRNYLVVGEKEKARRAMLAALQLAKHNRYLCRVAARLFVHIDDQDRALHLLRNEPTIKNDPWLLAAEIAISSYGNRKSKFIDAGLRIIDSKQYAESQVSELAAAVGTVELMHGTAKRAKSLFQTSLISPTDNSLAQAQWAVCQEAKIVIPDSAWLIPESFEARTLASRHDHDWNNALQTCAKWLADEPFSVRPAMLGSYLAFRPEHTGMAEQFASAGLRCDNANSMLLNNRAVARVYQGKIDEAYEDIELALQDTGARDDAHLLATLGLIAFRSGRPDLGRDLYGQSVGWFSHRKERASVASALLYWLREEVRVDRSIIPKAIDMAQRISKMSAASKQPELRGMADLLLEEAKAAGNSTGVHQEEIVSEHLTQFALFHSASLFHVPDKAKQIAARLVAEDDLV